MCNGFDEATLVVAGDRVGFGSAAQTIICVMRSGGPLYRSISITAGRSWSTPTVIAITVALQGPHTLIALKLNSGICSGPLKGHVTHDPLCKLKRVRACVCIK